MKIIILLLLLLFSSTGWAQTAPDASAKQHFDSAQAAYEAGDFHQAILELERSWRLEERPETLALRVRVLESMGEDRLALDIIEQNRDQLDAIPNIYLVEERLRETLRQKEDVQVPVPEPEARSSFDTVGPILLGTLGVGLGVWSTLLLLPESCDLKLPSGDCQKGDGPSTGVGIGVGAVALGAITGAIYWWIAGAPEPVSATPSKDTP